MKTANHDNRGDDMPTATNDESKKIKEAMKQRMNHHYDDANAIFEDILEKNPKNIKAWYLKGRTLHQMKRFEEEIECYKKALSIDPDNEQHYNSLIFLFMGWAYSSQQKFKEALYCYNKALESGDLTTRNKARALASKGCDLIHLGHDENAKACLDEAKTLAPDVDDSKTWFNLGYGYVHLGYNRDAIESFDQALALDKKNIEAWCYKGFAHGFLNEIDEATSSFQKALEIEITSSSAYMGREFTRKIFLQKQQELLDYTKKYLISMLRSFTFGLNLVQAMFVIQFIVGIGLLLAAVGLSINGNQNLITLILGASGGGTLIITLLHSSPEKLQKNRVDLSQWMLAYFNWVNTVYAVNGTLAQKTQNKETLTWNEIENAHNYLYNLTFNTVKIIEDYCEFHKIQKSE